MLTLGEVEQDVWHCPRCGRGSPDARDEAAHLDAHRRLERDLTVVTWEILVHRLTRPEREHGDRNHRRSALVPAVLAAVLLGSLLLSLRTAEVLPERAQESTTPTSPTPTAIADPPTDASRSTADEGLSGPPPPSPAPRVGVDVQAEAPPEPSTAIFQPPLAGPTPSTTPQAAPVEGEHLLQLCIPSFCLSV